MKSLRRRPFLSWTAIAVCSLAACLPASRLTAQTPREVVKITGELHRLVLFSDGSIGGWGDMRDGQLGPKAAIRNRQGQAAAFVPIALPAKAIDIAATDNASFALLDDGRVFAFGRGGSGEMGSGDRGLQGSEIPGEVPGLRDVVSIAAGSATAFAVHKDGTVSAWGSRGSGLPGDGKHSVRWGESAPSVLTPARVPNVSGVVQVSVGAWHVLARTSAGNVYSWGSRGAALGRMLPEGIGVGLPELIPGLSDVVSVVAQAVSSAALKRDGTVWVWGSNEQAAFGNGQRDGDQITYTPVRVPGVQGVQALSGGVLGRHFLALLKIGSVQSWGNSDWGQAGSGISGEEQAKPALAKITGVKTVLGAGNNSYAVKTDGTLWIWGLGLPREWPLSANARIPVQLQLPDTK